MDYKHARNRVLIYFFLIGQVFKVKEYTEQSWSRTIQWTGPWATGTREVYVAAAVLGGTAGSLGTFFPIEQLISSITPAKWVCLNESQHFKEEELWMKYIHTHRKCWCLSTCKQPFLKTYLKHFSSSVTLALKRILPAPFLQVFRYSWLSDVYGQHWTVFPWLTWKKTFR